MFIPNNVVWGMFIVWVVFFLKSVLHRAKLRYVFQRIVFLGCFFEKNILGVPYQTKSGILHEHWHL